MNKEKWLSIQLGKPELDDAIKDLLSLSYELTAPKKCKPKSSAKNPGDSANGKGKRNRRRLSERKHASEKASSGCSPIPVRRKDEQALPGTLSCGCCDCR
ncbi:MAG: hypothetical protein ACLTCQ_18935 [Enterocloster bolteae]